MVTGQGGEVCSKVKLGGKGWEEAADWVEIGAARVGGERRERKRRMVMGFTAQGGGGCCSRWGWCDGRGEESRPMRLGRRCGSGGGDWAEVEELR